jgi:excisionase family DNA binding protein
MRPQGPSDARPLELGEAESRAESQVGLSERLALRPAEAARALGISERTLRTLLPELPHVRAGGVVLLPVEALRRWLDEQARRQPSRVAEIVAEGLRAVRPDSDKS